MHISAHICINAHKCTYLHKWHISVFPWKWKSLGHVHLFATPGLYSPWNSPGQNTGVGSLSLLQGIFPTLGSNPDLPRCRWILLPAEWSSQPREPQVPGGHLYCRQILCQLSYEGSPLFLNNREESTEEKFDERTRTFLFVRFNFRQKQDWYFRLI